MPSEGQGRKIEPVWEASGIAPVIKKPIRETYFLLEHGLLPARKIGGRWLSTIAELEEFLRGHWTPPPPKAAEQRGAVESKAAPPVRRKPVRRTVRRSAARAREHAEPIA